MAEFQIHADLLVGKLEKGRAQVLPPDNVVTVVEQLFDGESGDQVGTRTFNLTRETLQQKRDELERQATNAMATVAAIDTLIAKLWPGWSPEAVPTRE